MGRGGVAKVAETCDMVEPVTMLLFVSLDIGKTRGEEDMLGSLRSCYGSLAIKAGIADLIDVEAWLGSGISLDATSTRA